MAIIKCKMCGGDLNIIEGASTAECEFCGSVQTIPKVDDEKKLTLFARANRLRSSCEFDKAAGIYESIVADFPEEAEAYWGLVLCKYGIEYVDDPSTGRKIPTCHRSSYDSVMDDGNFEQAMENADIVAQKVYREEAKQIEKIRKGILEVSSKEQPYDIFICYKETASNGDRTLDSVLAQDLYSALTDKGYRVFFSRITLQGKLGEAYEPYIFAALNSARVMLAVGTCYEYYNAVWVKNEWSRYLKICEADKSKHLIPCYKGLDPEDMPKEFNHLQGADLGKMGAVQDILFNMGKYIPLKKQTTTVIQEKVVVGGSGSNKIASLLDRGNMALEDGDWAKADSFFEDVLNNDSKNAQAYLGKTLATEKCRTIDAFARKRKKESQRVQTQKLRLEPDQAHVDEMVHKFTLPGYVEQRDIRKLYDFDLSYSSEVAERKHQHRDEVNFWANHKLLSRAEKFAVGAVAENLEREKRALLSDLSDRVKQAENAEAASIAAVKARYEAHLTQADETAEKLYNQGIARRENYYQELLQIAKSSSDVTELTETAKKFAALGNYQDSKNLAEHCRKRANQEQTKLDAEAERQRIQREKQEKARKAKNKKIASISAIAAVVVIAVIVVINTVVIPSQNYAKAEALLANGQYEEAIIAFEAMNGYKDSDQKISECKTAIMDGKYQDAISLMEAGKYENAIAAFEALGDYQDSADKINECNAAILDRKYDDAIALLATGKYEEAIVAFESLGNYNDSAEKLKDANFCFAVSLIEQGEYVRAYEKLTSVADYKNAQEYLDKFYYLPVSVAVSNNSGKQLYEFNYNDAGLMTNATNVSDDSRKFIFDENGLLIREELASGSWYSFTNSENGTIERTLHYVGGDTLVYLYNTHGNKIAYYMDDDWVYVDNEYDEFNNLIGGGITTYSNGAANYYDETGKLIQITYDSGNLHIDSQIDYKIHYSECGEIDLELIWRNFRLICGYAVWYM